MRKKYLSALLFGALLVTSAGTFTSCKDYDDDINNLQEQIDKVVSDLESLKSEVNKLGGYVTDVKVENGKLVVTVDGKEPVSYELPTGAEMAEIKIDGEGNLIVGDENLGKVTGEVTVNEDGVLMIDGKEAGLKVGTEVIIKDSSNGMYTIQIGDETIQLPMATANVSVEIASGSKYFFTNYAATAVETEAAGGIVWGVAGDTDEAKEWAGPKGPVSKDKLLVGQISSVKVNVLPVSYDLGSQKLTLVDSEGNDAYATVNAVATNVEGPIESDVADSRAANSRGEWNLIINLTDKVNKDNAGKAFANKDNTKNLKYALSVNGTMVSGYDFVIDTQKNKEESAYNLRWTDLWLGSANAENNRVTVELGETEFFVKNANVYDYYIEIADYDKNDAELIGVRVENNKIIASDKAAGESIDFKVRVMDVMGNVTLPNESLGEGDSRYDLPLTITFGKTTSEVETLSPSEYNISNIDPEELIVDLGNTFSSLTAEQAVAIQKAEWTTTDDKFLIAKGAQDVISTTSIKYYSDAKCENEITNFDNAQDIKTIRYAKIVFDNYNQKAALGEHTAVLTLSNNKTGEIKKVNVPVNVTAPAFDDIFGYATGGSLWNDDTFTATVIKDGANIGVDLTNAFTAKDNTKFPKSGLEVSALKKNGSTSVLGTTSDLKAPFKSESVVKDNAFLVKDLSATVTYKITNNIKITKDFNIKLRSIFEGAEINYYVNGVAQEADYTVKLTHAANNTEYIDALVKTNDVKNGLAISFNGTELPYNSSMTSIGGVTIADATSANNTVAVSYTLENANHDKDGNGVSIDTDGTGDARNGTTGIVVSDQLQLQEGEGGTLVITFTDNAGIKTVKKINYAK